MLLEYLPHIPSREHVPMMIEVLQMPNLVTFGPQELLGLSREQFPKFHLIALIK